ncbi:MAG: hypothetical protein KDD64_05265 [Bdellovibrionales bacterium]|nr:hypothetical protein [Bdellovibrionales bacterium]
MACHLWVSRAFFGGYMAVFDDTSRHQSAAVSTAIAERVDLGRDGSLSTFSESLLHPGSEPTSNIMINLEGGLQESGFARRFNLQGLHQDPVHDRAHNIAVENMTEEERAQYNAEIERYRRNRQLYEGGALRMFSPEELSPGPMMREIEKRTSELIEQARLRAFEKLAPEQKDRLLLEGMQEGKQQTERDFEQKVLDELQRMREGISEAPEEEQKFGISGITQKSYQQERDEGKVTFDDPLASLEQELEKLRENNPYRLIDEKQFREDMLELTKQALTQINELAKAHPELNAVLEKTSREVTEMRDYIQQVCEASATYESLRQIMATLPPDATERMRALMEQQSQKMQENVQRFSNNIPEAEGFLEAVLELRNS